MQITAFKKLVALLGTDLSRCFRLNVVHSLHVSASTAGAFRASFPVRSITTCTKDYGFVIASGGDIYHIRYGDEFWRTNPYTTAICAFLAPGL